MSFSSWLRSWKSALAPASSGKPRRLHRSRPAPSTRLGVEGLEDRSLPSAAHGLLADVLPHHDGVASGAVARDDPYGPAGILAGPRDSSLRPYLNIRK